MLVKGGGGDMIEVYLYGKLRRFADNLDPFT